MKKIVITNTTTGTLSAILSGSGFAAALTGVGLAASVPLACLAGLLGATSVVSGFWLKKLWDRLVKCEKIVSHCRSQTDAIKATVSKALEDNEISHEEFLSVKSEVEKYYEGKNTILVTKKQS